MKTKSEILDEFLPQTDVPAFVRVRAELAMQEHADQETAALTAKLRKAEEWIRELEGKNRSSCACANRRELSERYECVDCGKLHFDII